MYKSTGLAGGFYGQIDNFQDLIVHATKYSTSTVKANTTNISSNGLKVEIGT